MGINSLIMPLAAALATAVAWTATPAAAQDVQPLGTFNDWEAFSYTEDGNKVCYMVSVPQKEQGDYTERGDTYAMVTHRPAKGATDVVSIIAGYPYKDGSEVGLDIGGHEFSLFTHEDSAWAPNVETDKALIRAMRRGLKMIIKGRSARGTLTTDTYSLRGFTAAHKAIGKACGV